MKTPALLKPLPMLALIAIGGLSSCDQVRNLVGKLGKKPAAAAVAAGSATAEIPKEVREMLAGAPGRIVMVDYYADWCGPCRMLSPILEKVAGETGGTVQVCKVNVDQFRELATRQGVSSIPDVRIYQDGKCVEKFVGALPEAEVRKRLEGLIRNLPAAPAAEAPEAGNPKPKEAAMHPMSKDWMPSGVHRR